LEFLGENYGSKLTIVFLNRPRIYIIIPPSEWDKIKKGYSAEISSDFKPGLLHVSRNAHNQFSILLSTSKTLRQKARCREGNKRNGVAAGGHVPVKQCSRGLSRL